MVGQPIGNWILGEELGRGPVGVVYRAVASDDPTREAAVKILVNPSFSSPEFLKRFPAEILALHRLTHPNIVTFYDAGVHAGQAWFASELVEGEDLGTVLRQRATKGVPLGLRWSTELLPIAVQLLQALKHGHLRSLLHRSLKPSNVLLTTDGIVKITDFGIAKFLAIAPMNLPPDPWGTVGGLAPELFQGKPFTRKSDIYAFGVLLYTLIAGRPPFSGTTINEFLHKHCYTLPDRPIHFAPDMPNELDELICHLIAKDPARRPVSAIALLPVIERIRGKAERKGIDIPWPDAVGGTSTVLPALTEQQLGDVYEGRPRPLLSRPLVVIPLFLIVVGLLITLTFWPRPTAEQLIQEARPLLASDNPENWDMAWDSYLVPLRDRYPNQYAEEINVAKQKIQNRKELTRALRSGNEVKYSRETQRLYHRGLKLYQAGEFAMALQVWEQLVVVFGGIEAEKEWVRLAETAIREAKQHPKPATVREFSAIEAAVGRAQALTQMGQLKEAEEILRALRELFEDDPEALILIPK
jgi:eukaryotic-like serine/threonine-protein kinase